MPKKINTKKRNVKKKISKRKKYFGAAQLGMAFEKMAHRKPLTFNFIKDGAPEIKGDPFEVSEEAKNRLKHLHNDPYKLLNSPLSTGAIGSTRMELGTAPAHYSKGKYTPWEIIDDWKLDYYTGNAMKYVCRHKHKGKPVEDIDKAIDCLIKYRDNLKKEMGL